FAGRSDVVTGAARSPRLGAVPGSGAAAAGSYADAVLATASPAPAPVEALSGSGAAGGSGDRPRNCPGAERGERSPVKRKVDWVTALQLGVIPVGIVSFFLLLGEGRVALAWTSAGLAVAVFAAGSVARGKIRRQARARVQKRLDDEVLGTLRYDGEES